jgi:hypothetical protein
MRGRRHIKLGLADVAHGLGRAFARQQPVGPRALAPEQADSELPAHARRVRIHDDAGWADLEPTGSKLCEALFDTLGHEDGVTQRVVEGGDEPRSLCGAWSGALEPMMQRGSPHTLPHTA